MATCNIDYNAIHGIRATQIKSLAIGGPRALWESTFGEPKTTASLSFGTLTHLRLLQPEKWNSQVLVESVDRRTKDGKARAAEIEASGKLVCKPEDAVNIEHILCEWNAATKNIIGSEWEPERIYQAIIGGVECKAQIDVFNPKTNTIVDLKTVSDINSAYNEIWRRRYDLQPGHYANCIMGSAEKGDFKAYLVFVETESPFRVKVFDLTAILPNARLLAAAYAKKADGLIAEFGNDLEKWPQPEIEKILAPAPWVSDNI